MIKYLSLLLILVNLACQPKNKTTDNSTSLGGETPKIVFETKNHDFGQITEGDTVSYAYKFKNMGTMPLRILDVKVACGCTVAEKPEDAIGLGQQSQIKIKFNSSGKEGVNKKVITVTSNASNAIEELSFDVVVVNNSKQ